MRDQGQVHLLDVNTEDLEAVADPLDVQRIVVRIGQVLPLRDAEASATARWPESRRYEPLYSMPQARVHPKARQAHGQLAAKDQLNKKTAVK